MIYGDNSQKINEWEDKLWLKSYTMVPKITSIMQSRNLYVYGVSNPMAYIDLNSNVVKPASIIGAIIGAGGGALLMDLQLLMLG